MFAFSQSSSEKLATANTKLQAVFNEVIKYRDCTITAGHRGQVEQDDCCKKGLSKVKWPNSPHNATPARAVDAVPFPIDYKDREYLAHFAGFVLGVAAGLGIKLRWGGDWNQNGMTKDETFLDMPHFELVD